MKIVLPRFVALLFFCSVAAFLLLFLSLLLIYLKKRGLWSNYYILFVHLENDNSYRIAAMRRFATIIMCLLLFAGASAQNRNTAKKLFNEGKYAEAKPMFKKLLKGSPKNSEYNYWYAACCIETADSVEVVEMLEFAASRNIANAFKYLGDIYFGEKEYPVAADYYSDFIDKTKSDSLRALYKQRLSYCERLDRMVRNTEMVCIIDSIVLEKENFLRAYSMGADVGRLASCASYFDDPSLPGHLNETERGMDIFFSDESGDTLPQLKLFHRSKVGDEWGKVMPVAGFDTGGNDDYPFLLSDGTTLYFASDGEGSIGGYDIFVSRMNTEDGFFLRPDNLGMPFNSPANDYMMAINEVANLGWFASDRNQPQGKVCVYIFVPNEKRVKVDVDEVGYERALSLAEIESIADTQTDDEAVRKARQQLALLAYSFESVRKNVDFLFIIDDFNEYKTLSDFRSSRARELFEEWQAQTKQHKANVERLEQYRLDYASATAAARNGMRSRILQLETQVEDEVDALVELEYEVRRVEQQTLYGEIR